MTLVGCLLYHDERPDMLYECVRSLGAVVDGIQVLHCRFTGYPDEPCLQPPAEQSMAIMEAAAVACLRERGVVVPYEPEIPTMTQIEARAHVMQAASEWGSWLLVIDGDERAVLLDLGFRAALESLPPGHNVCEVRGENRSHMRRLFRADQESVTVERSHNGYRMATSGRWLAGHSPDGPLEPTVDLSNYLEIAHHRVERDQERHERAARYRIARREAGEQ